MKRSFLLAAAVAIASAISFSAQAGSITEYSNTWKPGFFYDEDSRKYTKITYVEKDTGYNPGGRYLTKTEVSQFYKPGYQRDDNGNFFRVVQVLDPKFKPELAQSSLHKDGVGANKHEVD